MKYRSTPHSSLAAVVFDLDGTLVDSAGDIASALNHALVREGIPSVPLDKVRPMIGDGVAALVAKTFKYHAIDDDQARLERVVQSFMTFAHSVPANSSTLYSGIDDLLRTLRRREIKVGICTNKPHDLAGRVVAALGMSDLVQTFVGGGRFAMKPDAASLLATIAALDTTAAETVYVGDMRVDYLTAINADVAFVGVDYGYWRYDLPDMDQPFVVKGADRVKQVLLGDGATIA